MNWTFERVAGPFKGRTGGLAWDGQAMLFSVVQEERVLRLEPSSGRIIEFRKYTGRTNGITMAADGSVFGAQEGGRRVIRFLPDGSTVPTCDLLDGQHHHQPTDLVLDRNGQVWFADPYNPVLPFGPDGIFPYLEHASVLRLERDASGRWTLVRVTCDTQAPRALAFSLDQSILYVADGDAERGGGPCTLRAYHLDSQGHVQTSQVLHYFAGADRGIEGLCIDGRGLIVACGGWAAGGPGPRLMLFSPSGELLAEHPAPTDLPMRCAFGGANLEDIYLTTGTGEVFRAQGTGLRGCT